MYPVSHKQTITLTFLVFWIVIGSCSPSYRPNDSNLPVVDLGYVKQRATVYNETNDWYIFKNIRFAAPPLGNLRFRKPQSPISQEEIQDGAIEDISCYQAFPLPFKSLGITSEGVEDCLFLDVYVPRGIEPTDHIPVLAWFYGGGYVFGNKGFWGDPTGLIKSAEKPMIYVASNYRLGVFGWLSHAEEDIDINVGLHDVRAAMEWIQDHIMKFGGDKERVTVIGESAGGGVILSTVTAYGGQHSPPPFQQAILQSPAMSTDKKNSLMHATIYNAFESTANCTNLECLRQAPTEVLKVANRNVVLSGVSFGPVVDGDYVPDIPMKLLVEGKFHRNLKSVITANTGFESGIFFPSPDNITVTTFDENVRRFFPNARESVIRKINELYPNGTEKWKRNTDLFSDVIINCNTQALAQVFKDKAYRYIFNILPAYHAEDIAYTFYNGPGFNPLVKSDWAAVVHQKYITDYIIYGKPGCGGTSPCFPTYGSDSNSLSMNLTEVEIIKDPWDYERCHFLQYEAFED